MSMTAPRCRLAPLLALLLAGCPHPLRFGPEGEITDPAVLLSKLDQRAARTISLKAEARVRVKTPQQSGTVGEFIAAMRPAALHLETLNFFGKPVAVLASDGQRFGLYVEETGTYYTGPATAANVSRLLPLTLEPEEAVMLLLGDIPRIAAEEMRLEVDGPARAYLVTLQARGVTQRLWVATEDLRPLRSQIRGAPAYDLALSDFQAFDGVVLPMKIELVSVNAAGERSGVELAVSYKQDTEVNPRVDLSLFFLPQPPGSKLVELDANGREKGTGQPAPAPPLPLGPGDQTSPGGDF